MIASMASLISYKQIVREYPETKRYYLRFFTITNGMMLGIYAVFVWVISNIF